MVSQRQPEASYSISVSMIEVSGPSQFHQSLRIDEDL